MQSNRTEKCVCCGKDSGVPCGTPIAERRYYIQGSGQLCRDCYNELYVGKSDDECAANLRETQKLILMSAKKENRK